MSLTIAFPFTDEEAQSVVVAADAMGVEPWEMAVHVLNVRDYVQGRLVTMPARGAESEKPR